MKTPVELNTDNKSEKAVATVDAHNDLSAIPRIAKKILEFLSASVVAILIACIVGLLLFGLYLFLKTLVGAVL